MDALLMSLGMYAVNCAGRLAVKNGISYTAQYTTKQCSRLLKSVDDKRDREELKKLQKLLNSKIEILSPAIDLIEFKSGRGNAFLEPAVPLVKALQQDVAALGGRLEAAAAGATEEAISGQRRIRSIQTIEQRHAEIRGIIKDIKSLLARVDQEIHFIQLAITASGETLSSSMSPGVSPSRLLQASALLNMGDCQFASDPTRPVQIGPSFSLSLYMLFVGHSSSGATTNGDSSKLPATPKPLLSGGLEPPRQGSYGLGEGDRKPIWQEVIHKARFRICRTPSGWVFDREKGYCPDQMSESSPRSARAALARSSEYSYHLEIIEDLDDGRLHDEEGSGHQSFDDISLAGMRESLLVSEISKIFYTDTGRLLNIGNSTENNPVLLLKRDVQVAWPSQPRSECDEEGFLEAGVAKTIGPFASDSDDDDQYGADRQLFEESKLSPAPPQNDRSRGRQQWKFPQQLDQEWLALEVFVDNGEEDSEDDDGDTEGQGCATPCYDDVSSAHYGTASVKTGHERSSLVDYNLVEQIRNISIRSPRTLSPHVTQQHDDLDAVTESPESLMARSPYGNIKTSLSLLEMLIRLTSLQQFQQTSHLAIPDYILTFFLEETSTTGLKGEERWKARTEAKKRVGFDPYTDTPTRDTPS